MEKQEFNIIDSDGRNTKCLVWNNEENTNPKCVIQISHGMEEHIERYEPFAEYLCKYGYAVCASDHPGHGTTTAKDELGYFGKSGYLGCVDRLHCVTLAVKQKFPYSPVILLGHSMGSFMARAYITRYGKEINGAIIMGTSGPNPMLGIGKVIIKLLSFFIGEKSQSAFVNQMMFGAYNKYFDGESKFEWLSRDKSVVKAYEQDDYCGFGFTMNGYKALLDVLSEVSSKNWANDVPKNLPLLIVSGKEDPVGDYGEGVKIIYERLKQAGVKTVKLMLFNNDRHEILNEPDKEDVYNTIIKFAEEII